MKTHNAAKSATLVVLLLSSSLLTSSLQGQNLVITTLAGGTQGALDGLNTNAQFYNPTGVTADSSGNVYVADKDNNLIRKITPSGVDWAVSTLAGGGRGSLNGTNAGALFSGPTGIVMSGGGNLYVTDQYNSVIRQITLSGTNNIVTTIAGAVGSSGSQNGTNGGARFANPTGLAMDASGNLYVADEVNNAIRKIAPSGTNWIVTTIAGGSAGANNGTNTLAQFSGPSGVAVDSGGRVFVADQFNNTIRLITPVGTNWVVSTIAGQSLAGLSNGVGTNVYFDAPLSVAVDSNDNVYVADLFNNAIRKLTPDGTNWAASTNWVVSTVAGGSQGGNNGTGAAASFDLPFGVATDAYGNVYIADSGDNAIRGGLSSANPAPTGTLQVFITPTGAISAGAKWQLDGAGPAQTNGAILSGLAPGNHYANFYAASGYTIPPQTNVAVTARQAAVATVNYSVAVANAGSLQVLLSPAASVNAGAQWNVDSGVWQNNNAIVAGLAVGAHTVSFLPVVGWTPPANQAISIGNALTTVSQAGYVLQTGFLQVTLLPVSAVSGGAEWQIDGGTYRTSGSTLSGLLPGSHSVGFNTVLGWETPSNQIVTITHTLTTSTAATYSLISTQPGQLTGGVLAGGKFQFQLSGQVNSSYLTEVSPNLTVWTPLSTNIIPAAGSILVTDTNTAAFPRRFYRAVNQ